MLWSKQESAPQKVTEGLLDKEDGWNTVYVSNHDSRMFAADEYLVSFEISHMDKNDKAKAVDSLNKSRELIEAFLNKQNISDSEFNSMNMREEKDFDRVKDKYISHGIKVSQVVKVRVSDKSAAENLKSALVSFDFVTDLTTVVARELKVPESEIDVHTVHVNLIPSWEKVQVVSL